MNTHSLFDVQARWGYSEIDDSNFKHFYDNTHDIESLRAKRRGGVPFESLSLMERYSLAFQCCAIRPNLLIYLTSIDAFDLIQISHTDLGRLLVPPNVWGDTQGRIVPFEQFMMIPAPDSGDARNVVCDSATYQPPNDPVTIGRFYQYQLLLDGYHRAAAFWKCGPVDGYLPAYMPHGPPIDKS